MYALDVDPIEIVKTKERLEKNRETEAELTAGEKELLDNIKKAKAGNL